MTEPFFQDRDWYQGVPESHTALFFGEVSTGSRPQHIHAHFGREAYEIHATYTYTKELLRVLHDPEYVCWSPGFGLLWAAIESLGGTTFRKWFGLGQTKPIYLEEVGSTLFATIDKLEKLNAKHRGNVKMSAIRYIGIEPSEILAQEAVALHAGRCVSHLSRWQDLPDAAANTVERSYQATSYAFASSVEFAIWMKRARFGLHGVWFSNTNDDRTITVHGKRATFFSPRLFHRSIAASGYSAIPISSESFFLGDQHFISGFVVTHNLGPREWAKFQSLCKRCNNFGIQSLAALDEDSFDSWIRSRAAPRGSHAGFLEGDAGGNDDATTFNFSSQAVKKKFSSYVNALESRS